MVRSGIAAITCTGCGIAFAFSPAQLVPMEFAWSGDVATSHAVFVCGSVEELGANDVGLSCRLATSGARNWYAKIGVPPGEKFTYRYYDCDASPAQFGLRNNGTTVSDEMSTNSECPSAGQLPVAPTSLYVLARCTSACLSIEASSNSSWSFKLDEIGAGRSSGERLFHTRTGSPGRSLRFNVFEGNVAAYRAGVYDYETFAQTAWLQDGAIYNYMPAGGVSTSRIEVLPEVASPQGLLARQLRVYLPRGYDSHPWRRYPVLYMHDGQNLFGKTGTSFPPVHWDVDGTLDHMIGEGQVRELIVVGIDNTKDRMTDYTPPGAPEHGIKDGRADKYLAYVRDTVKPMIDKQYRTLPDAANTGVAGSSLGGIVSTYFGMEAPEVFTKIGAMSPAYMANRSIVDRLSSDAKLPAWRHYMDCGTAGVAQNGSPDGYDLTMEARDRILRRGHVLGVDVLNVVGIGQQHNESAWQARFPHAVRFLFPIEDEASNLSAAALAAGPDRKQEP